MTKKKEHGNVGKIKPHVVQRARAAALAPPPFFQNMGPPPADARPYHPSGSAWDPLPGSTPVSFADNTGCKWPCGPSPFLFCNEPRAGQAPYCEHHATISKSRIHQGEKA